MIALMDIGGTSIKYGIVDPETERYERLGELETNTQESNFQMKNRIDEVIKRGFSQYKITGIGISTAGIVDNQSGEIVYANKNIPNYKGSNLKEKLEKKYEIPVAVENDVNSALLGELHFGLSKEVHSALMLTIGTGVGGALYINNQIYHGFSHSAGEVGYAIINGKNIEEIASTNALVQNVKKRLSKEEIDGHWIFDQAIEQNNIVCIEEIENIVINIVLLMNNYVALINPEVVILGGGIMEQSEYLKPLVIEKFNELNKNELVIENTKIEFATLGNQAGLLGAYCHYKKQIKEDRL